MADDAVDKPMPCHFLDKLPAELRVKIYKLLPTRVEHCTIRLRPGSKGPWCKLVAISEVTDRSFLMTCRTIYEDAKPTVYALER
jgi:hypothetical protein